VLAFPSEREDSIDEITGIKEVTAMQAQVPQHTDDQNKESDQTKTPTNITLQHGS
jgi:microcystin-dependent protein